MDEGYGIDPEDSILLEINSDFEGIKQPFCPKWFQSSNNDLGNYLFLLSDCGDDDVTLYRAVYTSDMKFEEVRIPQELLGEDLNLLKMAFDTNILILYFEESTKAWIIRNQEFDFYLPLDLTIYITNEEFKNDGVIDNIMFQLTGEIVVDFRSKTLNRQILVKLKSKQISFTTVTETGSHMFDPLNSLSLYKEVSPGNICELNTVNLLNKGNKFGAEFINLFYC